MRAFKADDRLAAIAGLLSVIYWPAIFAAPTMPRWWLIAVAVPLLCPLNIRKVDRVAALLFGAGLFWGAITIFTQWSVEDGALPFYNLIILGLVAVAAASVEDLNPTLYAMALGGALSGIVCVLQIFHISFLPMIGERPTGLFYNSEVLAEFIAPVFVWAFLKKKLVLSSLLMIPLLVCQSKIALVAAAIGLILATFRNIYVRAAILVSAIVIIFAGSTLLGLHWEGTATHRLTLWGAALFSIVPLGHGFGWWYAAHPFGYEEFAHSDVLQLLVENGLGGIFFIAIPVMVFWRGVDDKILGATFASLCFEGCVSFPIHLPATAFLVFGLAGYLSRAGARLRVPQRRRGMDGGPYLRWKAAFGERLAVRRRQNESVLWDRPTYSID